LTQVLILNEILEELNVMGFGIRDFGNHDFVVDCIPADMEDTDLQSQMEEILEIYTQSKSVQTEKLTNAALALSVVQTKKMSNQLSDEEIEIFIQQLFSTELPELSPSGKKTYVKLANSDMKVWFD
jgi:DNA mismatch repair protein MutL